MATEKRLIDLDIAIERARASDKIVGSSIWETSEVVEFLEDCPTVDAVEVVHGRWVETKNGFHCSNCKRRPGKHPSKQGAFLSDYCPNCGAKMDGGKDDESSCDN